MSINQPETDLFPVSLSRYLSIAGVASRRHSAELVKQGKILVNDKVVTEPGTKIHSDDLIKYLGKKISVGKRYYILLNKPKGYVCTSKDPHVKNKAIDLVELPEIRLYTVGRLDKNSEGLLIITNDGDYAAKLTHPSHEILKTYLVTTNKPIPANIRKTLCKGIKNQGEDLSAKEISEVGDCQYRFVLNEGKKREIRRMVSYAQRKTLRLQRIAIGQLSLGNLETGKWRFMTEEEIELSLKTSRD